MGYIVLFVIVWLLFVGLGLYGRAKRRVTNPSLAADMYGLMLWATAAALAAVVIVAGIVGVISAIMGAF